MKVLISLLFFTYSCSPVFAGLPPTSTRPQSNTNKTTTFNFEAPFNQFTQTAAVTSLLETGNQNILPNPSFEATTYSDQWSFLGGFSCAETTVGQEYTEGKKGASCTGVNSAATVAQNTTLPSIATDGRQVLASLNVSTASEGFAVCLIQGVTEIVCKDVPATGKFTTVSVVGDLITTGLSFGVRLKSTNATSKDVLFDQGYVGIFGQGAVGLGLSMSDWVDAGTITFTGAPGSFSSKKRRQVGDSAEYMMIYDLSGAATTTFEVGLDLTVDESKVSSGDAVCYVTALDANTVLFYSGVGRYNSSTNTINIGGPANSAWTTTAPITWASTDSVRLNCTVPISGYSSYSAATVVGLVPGETVYSATVSSADAVTNESTNWINGDCTNAGTGLATCTFVTGFFTAEPNCVATATTASRIVAITSKSSSSITLEVRNDAGTAIDSGFTLACQRATTDYTNARNTYQNMALGTLATPGGASTEVVARAKITCSGSSSVVSQSGSWISTIGNISAGQCTVTINGFASAPACVISYNGGFTTAVVVSAEVTSSTSIATDCATSPSTACGSYDANLICMGPRQ